MQASQIPSKIPLPFASSGSKNTIPTASQIGITAGAASLTDGFPPLTFTPIASGGVPPSGADFNGILNMITAIQQWQSAGGGFRYDAAFSTAIGGYPKGAVVTGSSGLISWRSAVDNNTTDPDGGSPSGWLLHTSPIGNDQTWQTLTGSRALATTYTNSTGRAIAISVSVVGTVNGSTVSLALTVNGVSNISESSMIAGAIANQTELTASAIIPPGATYSTQTTQATVARWTELR